MNDYECELIGESIWNTYTYIGQVLAEGILGAAGGAAAGLKVGGLPGAALGAAAGHVAQKVGGAALSLRKKKAGDHPMLQRKSPL